MKKFLLSLSAVLLAIPAFFAQQEGSSPSDNADSKAVVATRAAVGTIKPTSTSPSLNQQVIPISPLSVISFTFNQQQNGIYQIFRTEHPTLELKKDGDVVQTISTESNEKVTLNRNNPNQLDIYIEPVSAPGEYSITLPADFIRLDNNGGGVMGSEETEVETDPAKLQNAEYTLKFSIVDVVIGTVNPTPGEVEIDQLKTVTITYPEGTVISANSSFNSISFAPFLYFKDETWVEDEENPESRPIKQLTKYDVSFSDNVVTLTAVSPSAISDEVNNQLTKYDYITIPAGAWLVNGDPTPSIIYQKYTIKDASGSEGKDDKPELSPAADKEVASTSLKNVTITYPDSWTFNAYSKTSNPLGKKEGFIVGSLRATPSETSTEGTNVGDFILQSVNETDHTLILQYSDSGTPLKELESGYYCIMITGNMFVLPNKSKNTTLYFPGYTITKSLEDPEVNTSYSIGGPMVGTSFAYNADFAFAYDADTQTWTKTVVVDDTNKGKYFSIYNNLNVELNYNTAIISGAVPAEELFTQRSSMRITTPGEYTFIITEKNTTPRMEVRVATVETTSWTLEGVSPVSTEQKGDTYTWNIDKIDRNTTFKFASTTGDVTQYWGTSYEPETGYDYDLEPGKDVTLSKDYEDVVFTLNTASKTFTFSGTEVVAEDGTGKYSVGGPLFGTAWEYNAEDLFDYDATTNTWKKTLNITGNGGYFNIYAKSNPKKGLCYKDNNTISGPRDTAELAFYDQGIRISKAGTYYLEITENGNGIYLTVSDKEISTGVEAIDIDNAEAIEIYTLSGVRVDTENILPGLYIVVSNGKASKKYIR
ncbi:MAG: hypothetical protein NC186_06190 [Prevotella sp.]|nr:hypothetical protein [Prevotella sp.]